MALSNEDKIFISQLLDAKIKPVQLLLENDVLPRVQNIESCILPPIADMLTV